MLARAEHVQQRTITAVEVAERPLARLEPLIGEERFRELRSGAGRTIEVLGGSTVWNVSSTAAGGGVAEMLQVLIGYSLDAGIDSRWLVMAADPEFFTITKRIHNRLHGSAGDSGPLGAAEQARYQEVADANAVAMTGRIRRGDVVLLHDPQTAGMARRLAEAGAHVIWRCHVGRRNSNGWTDEAWSFLRPHLDHCEAYVFTMQEYVPPWMEGVRVRIIPPSIDPFAPKNQDMAPADVVRSLRQMGLLPGGPDHPGPFIRRDGTPGRITRKAAIAGAGDSTLGPDTPVVVQVSRWDRLKDMQGVLEGFVSAVPGRLDAHLALVGPSVTAVADDPEGTEVYAECLAAWGELPADVRRCVSLVTLPMEDVDENAAMVNAIQRHASVIVQKSLEEGFGLTVAEGMWKGKAVVASDVGGITEQIVPGCGILLGDPTDLAGFGSVLVDILSHPRKALDLGARARQHVLEHFVGDRHLLHYAQLVSELCAR